MGGQERRNKELRHTFERAAIVLPAANERRMAAVSFMSGVEGQGEGTNCAGAFVAAVVELEQSLRAPFLGAG